MAKKQEETKIVAKTDNVAIVKQKILNHLHGKETVDLQELYNLL
jgi:hypothetical protein